MHYMFRNISSPDTEDTDPHHIWRHPTYTFSNDKKGDQVNELIEKERNKRNNKTQTAWN